MRIIQSICVIGILLAICFRSTLKEKIFYGESTLYAKNYTESNFRTIVKGMTEDRVRFVLGEPLEVTVQSPSENWYYFQTDKSTLLLADSISVTGKVLTDSVAGSPTAQFFLSPYKVVCLDSNGLVSSVGKNDANSSNLVGLSGQAILSKLGIPAKIEKKPYLKKYFYSRNAGSGAYKVRVVHFNRDGKVESITMYTLYD